MLPVDGANMERERAKMSLVDQCFYQLKPVGRVTVEYSAQSNSASKTLQPGRSSYHGTNVIPCLVLFVFHRRQYAVPPHSSDEILSEKDKLLCSIAYTDKQGRGRAGRMRRDVSKAATVKPVEHLQPLTWSSQLLTDTGLWPFARWARADADAL